MYKRLAPHCSSVSSTHKADHYAASIVNCQIGMVTHTWKTAFFHYIVLLKLKNLDFFL